MGGAVPPAPLHRGRGVVFAYGTVVATALVLAFLGHRDGTGITLEIGPARIPFAFAIFGLVLLAVALFHRKALLTSLLGAVFVTLYTALLCPEFAWGKDLPEANLWGHALYEGKHTLLNLAGLLLGFSLLAKSFEESDVPARLPRLLPKGPYASAVCLLAMVWVLSAFLDNIAAAMIGGVVARRALRGRVTVGYLAAMVASSNAGGAWSVVGDTTTTMMWIDGIPASAVAPAALSSAVAFVVLAVFGVRSQVRVQPIVAQSGDDTMPIDGVRLAIVATILVGAVASNLLFGMPFLGVWIAILLGALVRRPAWSELPGAAKGAVFLLALVWCASLMPVGSLPPASERSALGLGFVSAVFDNIPLTKLALEKGGYDWGLLAYAVGFGGSMLWFGSSAGVAISKDFPEARDAVRWLREGCFIPLAYVAGFFAHLLLLGWNPA